MMDIGQWVLIVVFRVYGGAQVTYQEFDTKGQCEIAQKTMLSMKSPNLENLACVRIN